MRIRRIVWRGLSEVIGSWKIICMRRLSGRICCSGSCVMSRPSNTMRPASMSMSRMSARPSVVFPEPDSPTMPTVSPRPILRSTPCRTLTPPTRSPFRRRFPHRRLRRRSRRRDRHPCAGLVSSVCRVTRTSACCGSSPLWGRTKEGVAPSFPKSKPWRIRWENLHGSREPPPRPAPQEGAGAPTALILPEGWPSFAALWLAVTNVMRRPRHPYAGPRAAAQRPAPRARASAPRRADRIVARPRSGRGCRRGGAPRGCPRSDRIR